MIKPVNPKGNQSKIFIGRTEAGAEAPIFWPLDVKSWLIRKESEEEKGTTEDKMVGGHHRLNGHEFEQALGDEEGQGSLECCSPWDCKESDMTEQLNKWDLKNQAFEVLTSMPWLVEAVQSCSAWLCCLVILQFDVCLQHHLHLLVKLNWF